MRRGTRYLRFGPVRQETGAKHVQVGNLLEAVNVRQTAKAGVYAKRRGFARTAQTFVGGSLSGAPIDVLPGSRGNSLMRDSGDQMWARSNSTNQWTLSGTSRRPWPETTTVQSNLYTVPMPFSCLVGTNLWVFAIKGNTYEFSIVDATTGISISPKYTNTATSIVRGSAAYDGTYVWVFWVDNGANGTIRCHRIAPASPSSAPTATTYYTLPASPTDVSTCCLQQVQARYLSTMAKVVVVACGGRNNSGTYKKAVVHSILDPATGQASAAAGETPKVQLAYSGATGPYHCGGLCILDNQTGAGATWYYTYVHWDTASSRIGRLVSVSTSDTQSATQTDQFAVATGLSNAESFSIIGYTSGLNQYIFLTIRRAVADYITTDLHQFNNHVLSESSLAGCIEAWPASGFATVGSRWYALTGRDDWTERQDVMGAEGSSLQRAFHLREFVPGASASVGTFNVVAQFAVGTGPAISHLASGAMTFGATTPPVNCVPVLHVVGNTTVSCVALASGVTGFVDLAVARIDFAKAYGRCAQIAGLAVAPGNLPVVWNGNTAPHEIAPLDFPTFLSVAGGTGSDFTIVAACFAFYDGSGVVWRSAPKIVSTTVGHGAVLTIPHPTISGNATVYAEWYIGTSGQALLQTAAPYNGTDRTMQFTTPTTATMVIGEPLYTTGNALANTWPVACQAVGTWNNRLFLAQKNRVWFSRELEPGLGPLFNEVLATQWNEEQNEITALAAVDWNYFALLSEGQTAVISGPGPDGIGNGNYVVKTIPSYTGVAAGGAAIQGAQGCYYQNKQTGRLMCLTPDLKCAECAGGAYDYASYLITTATWYEAENLLVFWAPASNAAIVIDYQHPQETAPFGQVYLWTFAAALAPAVTCRDDYGLLLINSTGHVYRTSTSQWVDDNASGTDTYRMKLTTAELQLADIQGSFSVERVQTLFTMRSASGVSIDVYPGFMASPTPDSTAAVDLAAPAVAGNPDSVLTRPPNCARIESFRIVVLEKAGITGQSFEFEGFGIDYTAQGGLWRPAETRII